MENNENAFVPFKSCKRCNGTRIVILSREGLNPEEKLYWAQCMDCKNKTMFNDSAEKAKTDWNDINATD